LSVSGKWIELKNIIFFFLPFLLFCSFLIYLYVYTLFGLPPPPPSLCFQIEHHLK
jgi:hypothetical protein